MKNLQLILIALFICSNLQFTWANNDLFQIKGASKLYVSVPNEIEIPDGYEMAVKFGDLERDSIGNYIFTTKDYGNYEFTITNIESQEQTIIKSMVWREPWPLMIKNESGQIILEYESSDYPEQFKIQIKSFTVAVHDEFFDFDNLQDKDYLNLLAQHSSEEFRYFGIELYDPKTDISLYTKAIVE